MNGDPYLVIYVDLYLTHSLLALQSVLLIPLKSYNLLPIIEVEALPILPMGFQIMVEAPTDFQIFTFPIIKTQEQ